MLMVIDVETTGKLAGTHEIIQLSAMVVDEEGGRKISEFSSFVRAYRTELIDKEALKINQISLEQIISAPTSETVRANFLDWWVDLGIPDVINPCGWNYKFDEKFLELFFGKVEYENLFHYKCVDVYSLAWKAQKRGEIPKSVELSLENTSDFFNISHLPHDAMGDVYATWKLLQELM